MSRFVVLALIAGIVFIAVGLMFRFAPYVGRTSRWWPAAAIVAVVFGYAPRSWIPWGAAALLAGIAGAVGGGAAGAVNLLAALFLLGGVVLMFWHAPWMEPRSLQHMGEPPSRPEGG